MSSQKINVIKVPSNNLSSSDDIYQRGNSLPRIPRQYLELMENKEKIKPQLVNKDYDPSDAESVISDFKPKTSIGPVNIPDSISESAESSENDDDSVDISISDDEQEKPGKFVSDIRSAVSSEDDISVASSSHSSNNNNTDGNDDFSEKDDQSEMSEKNETRDKIRQMLQEDHQNTIPKLADLERDGMIKPNRTIPNLDFMENTIDEDEEDQKRELLFKFELLKKSYKNAEIPDFTIHSSFKKMNETYENQLRHLSLDSSVDNYKNILIAGFMVFEFIFGVWLKFDMSGFSQQQILNMSQYERLLIELGQKSYVPESQQWPVEFRLIGLIVINAVIFIISKMILKRTGNNLMGMMNHVQQPPPPEQKKKMKPPTVNFDEL